jgi:LuxR family transcriptional regulator, maltose regulon positive regulatory protein
VTDERESIVIVAFRLKQVALQAVGALHARPWNLASARSYQRMSGRRPAPAGLFSTGLIIVQSRAWAYPPNGGLERAELGIPPMELHSTSSRGPTTGKVLPGGKRLPFLATKIVAPRCPGLIDRPRLLAMASQLPAKRLAVIKAPAGFGKTSLALSWSEWFGRRGSSVAWLTIDSDDDEPSRFLFYVTQAIRRAAPEAGADALDLISETFLINPQAIVSTLINDLTDLDEDVCLFLEDYHWVTDPGIHDAVTFFLKHAPSQAHVILTTRTEPPLPLASLRANNQLLEIDASALRFDLQETSEFIEHEKPGGLAPADVKLLHSRSEGWPAQLRIVVSTSSSSEDFGQYVRNLSGMQRPIDAYLAEMLDCLPPDLVAFMLRTAILDRLSAPLCEAVAGASSARALLASIEKRQLLLTALDQEREWHRYHPLLAGYLKRRVESELGNELPDLHRRAAHWYASQELWTEAVQHAIAGGDADQALGWIKNCAMGLVKRGDLFTLLAWQRLFPPAVMRGQPEVRLAIAWGMALAIRCDEALDLVSEIERDIAASPSADAEVSRCECEVIRSIAIAIKDDSETALSIAQNCLGRSADPWTANAASNVVRFGHLKAGDLKKFYGTPWIPYSADDDRRNVLAAVYCRCLQGVAEAQQLRIDSADRYFREALRLAEQHVGPNSLAAALPASLIARIRYDEGRLDEAEAMLIDRVPLINAGTMLECVLGSYFVMARIAAHRRNLERAHTLLDWAESQGNARNWGRLSAAAVLERARLYLDEGRIDQGAECLDRLERLAAAYPAPSDCAWSDIHRYTALARAYLASAQARFDEAVSILNELRRELEGMHNLHLALRVEARLATVRFRAKQVAEASACFRGVVPRFAQAGIYHTFLDEGSELGPLLAAFQKDAERTGGSPELTSYVSKLIALWRSRYQSEPEQTLTSALAQSLSARESHILRLIADGLSNKEIARTLAITPETVKSHVKHIFVKLNVEKRAQAVSRAQMLGLAGTRPS